MEPSVPDPAGATISATQGAQPSQSFGSYRLLQKVGEGGMGEVWLAEQTTPVHRRVALEVIKVGMDTAHVVARFEAERQAPALMDHPAIATVFDGGTTPEGRPYFAMEYVKGEPFTTYCDRQRLTTAQRLELFIQVCEGVQHAHQKGVIHRDLKPSNVLVTIQGDRPVPKIIDFGIAKATAQHLTERTLFTELGILIGTPEYMSPEQAEMGALDIDTRADVYALGVMLYELLTGALPFDRKELSQAGLAEIQRIIRQKEPPRPSNRVTQIGPASTEAAKNRQTEAKHLASQLRGDLDWITMKALEKDRTRRYDTVNGLAQDLRRHLASVPVVAGPPSATYRAGKFVRRHRFGVAAAVTLVLLLAGFAATTAVQTQRIARQRDRAERLAAFLVDLFKVSDPSEARGNTITAREVLDKGAQSIGREFKDDSETKAALMATMGNVYFNLGLYGPATPLLEEALQLRRRLWGDTHREVGTSLSDLAWLLKEKGDHKKAEAVFREALAVRRVASGVGKLEIATSLNDLGAILFAKGDYLAAEESFKEALAIGRKVLGNRHLKVATTLHNLATILHTKGDFSGAESLYREVLEIKRANVGSGHPAVAATLANLAAVVHEQGELSSAESLYREVLAVEIRLFGNDHPDVARGLRNLAELLKDQGKYSEAEPLYREALAVEQKAVGPTHPKVAECQALLAEVLVLSGRADEAELLAREAAAIIREKLPTDHPDRAECETILGICLIKLNRYQEAEPLLLNGYQVLQVKEPRRLRTKRASDGLLALYDAWGKPDKAAEWRRKLPPNAR